MAKLWYPVIDILECAECGTCIGKCPHGVYDKERAPVPIVLHPEKCIDHCHGCGNLCPQGAIAYVGDDTGWKPPHIEKQESNEDMCCCCSTSSGKKAVIEYLYLDLNTCDRCCGTADILDDVVSALRPAWGIVLMLCYSIGHSALVMAAGTSVGFVQKINGSEKYKKAAAVLKIMMGAAILLIGLYMFWIAF